MAIAVPWLLPDGRVAGPAADGRMVRVAGAIPGDTVEYRRTGGSGRTEDGNLVEVVTPSAHRRAPTCPYSDACGGCDLDRLGPEGRVEALARMVGHAFRWDGEVPVHTGSSGRARIKLALVEGRLGYRAARSHELVPVERCAVARPEVQAAHERLGRWIAERPERVRGLGAVELRSDGSRVVFAFESTGTWDREALAELGDVAVDGKRVAGDPTLVLDGDGVRLRVSAGSFYQVNPEVNLLLVRAVGAAVVGAERVLDLYAGVGNLGLPIAARGTPVVAVESVGPGAEDLRHNAAGLPVEVIARNVEKLDPSRIPFDAVVLDPPRAGAPGVLAKVARNRPRVVVYVSCFAPSAARDLRELDGGRGYRLASLAAFDLFPDTHHVEAVAVLERR